MRLEPRMWLLIGGAAVLLLGVGFLVWVLFGQASGSVTHRATLGSGTNLALDVRFRYDTRMFQLAPYAARAEFPLRFDSTNPGAYGLYGKRISGLGRMLGKEPSGMLYDFIGQESDALFTESYGLHAIAPPVYEDCTIGGRLGLHQTMQFTLGQAKDWPGFFPAGIARDATVQVEGWLLLTEDDLLNFYAISPAPLKPNERKAVLAVLNSMQYGAITGKPPVAEPSAEEAAPADESGAAPADGAAAPAGDGAPATPDAQDGAQDNESQSGVPPVADEPGQ